MTDEKVWSALFEAIAMAREDPFAILTSAVSSDSPVMCEAWACRN
jgi:hypothetical protein